jgi:hypothetical protein
MNTMHLVAFAVAGLLTNAADAQNVAAVKMKDLVVYGEGFTFSVREPDAWQGDTDKAAAYHANILFYPKDQDPEKAPLVQVALFSKKDERTAEDLAYDVKTYKGQYADLQEEELKTGHQDYNTYSKLVYVKGKFHQYITYVNAGERYKSGFSVAMNVQGRAATNEELAAYRAIIASLWMMGVK